MLESARERAANGSDTAVAWNCGSGSVGREKECECDVVGSVAVEEKDDEKGGRAVFVLVVVDDGNCMGVDAVVLPVAKAAGVVERSAALVALSKRLGADGPVGLVEGSNECMCELE